MAITLRHGPAERERGIHAVSQAEIERLARAHGAFVAKVTAVRNRAFGDQPSRRGSILSLSCGREELCAKFTDFGVP
jgi:hypothetical protein